MDAISAVNLFNVKGLVAVVTGGGSGIGLMMAQALAINGAKVYIVGRRLDHLEKAAAEIPQEGGGSVFPLQGDVTDQSSLAKMAEYVEKEDGFINLLCCNSGVAGPDIIPLVKQENGKEMSIEQVQDLLWKVPMQDFAQVYKVNCAGVFYTTVAFLKLLDAGNRKQNVEAHSQVIATSSIASFNRAEPGGFAYGSSKAAVTHLMKSCATILSPYGIRFNVIAPGRLLSLLLCLPLVLMRVKVYPSELTQDYGPFHSSIHPDQEGSMPSNEVPAKRAGSPKDMAGNILYLASPAGAYVNGMVLITDGGRLSICPATY